jgi:DNA-binding MarR family transcriptional regulator
MNNPSNTAIARRTGMSVRAARYAGNRKIKIPYDIIYDTRPLELSSPAVTLYHHLQITEKILQKDICEECGIDARTYRKVYKELVEKGLLVVQ